MDEEVAEDFASRVYYESPDAVDVLLSACAKNVETEDDLAAQK